MQDLTELEAADPRVPRGASLRIGGAGQLRWACIVLVSTLGCSVEQHPDWTAQPGEDATSEGAFETGEGGATLDDGSVCDAATVVGDGSSPLIDDFEDGDITILPSDGRSGAWSSWADGSGALTSDLLVEEISDGLNGSLSALHLGGTGFTSWGAGAGPSLTQAGCYDFSAYGGITFSVKGNGLLRVAVATADTAAFFDCDESIEECANHYDTGDIIVTEQWTQYSFVWSELAQPNWGPEKPFDPHKGISLAFSHVADEGGGPSFDFWIDDVGFTPAP